MYISGLGFLRIFFGMYILIHLYFYERNLLGTPMCAHVDRVITY